MKNRWKTLSVSLLVSLGAGLLSAVLSGDMAGWYRQLRLPPGAPPAGVFPAVWTVLYLLMGVSAFLVWRSGAPGRRATLWLYAAQLAINAAWPLLFFRGQLYLCALVWLLMLWVFAAAMVVRFHRASPAAAWLQAPYLLWLTFALYLNYSVYQLNGV